VVIAVGYACSAKTEGEKKGRPEKTHFGTVKGPTFVKEPVAQLAIGRSATNSLRDRWREEDRSFERALKKKKEGRKKKDDWRHAHCVSYKSSFG